MDIHHKDQQEEYKEPSTVKIPMEVESRCRLLSLVTHMKIRIDRFVGTLLVQGLLANLVQS